MSRTTAKSLIFHRCTPSINICVDRRICWITDYIASWLWWRVVVFPVGCEWRCRSGSPVGTFHDWTPTRRICLLRWCSDPCVLGRQLNRRCRCPDASGRRSWGRSGPLIMPSSAHRSVGLHEGVLCGECRRAGYLPIIVRKLGSDATLGCAYATRSMRRGSRRSPNASQWGHRPTRAIA